MASAKNGKSIEDGNLSIDARGLKCPLPVLKLEKHLDTVSNPLPATLYADDPVARIDIPVLCNKRGLSCVVHEDAAAFKFKINAKI